MLSRHKMHELNDRFHGRSLPFPHAPMRDPRREGHCSEGGQDHVPEWTVITGTGAYRMVSRAVLPKKAFSSAFRPCVPMTMNA